jgi:hypothetical protein
LKLAPNGPILLRQSAVVGYWWIPKLAEQLASNRPRVLRLVVKGSVSCLMWVTHCKFALGFVPAEILTLRRLFISTPFTDSTTHLGIVIPREVEKEGKPFSVKTPNASQGSVLHRTRKTI